MKQSNELSDYTETKKLGQQYLKTIRDGQITPAVQTQRPRIPPELIEAEDKAGGVFAAGALVQTQPPRVVEAAQAVTTGCVDRIDYFEVPSHLMAALALALDETAAPQAQAQPTALPAGAQPVAWDGKLDVRNPLEVALFYYGHACATGNHDEAKKRIFEIKALTTPPSPADARGARRS